VFRRYLQLCPDNAEEYVEYLVNIDTYLFDIILVEVTIEFIAFLDLN
jgi:hypothetical protein